MFENVVNDNHRNSHIEKLCVKLSGRVALVALKPRAAKWKYERGNRITICTKKNVNSDSSHTEKLTNNDIDDIEIPDLVEGIGFKNNTLSQNIVFHS